MRTPPLFSDSRFSHLILSICSLRKKAEKLVTHQFPLSRTTEAFELLGRGRGPQGEVVLKVMVGPAGVGERDVVE